VPPLLVPAPLQAAVLMYCPALQVAVQAVQASRVPEPPVSWTRLPAHLVRSIHSPEEQLVHDWHVAPSVMPLPSQPLLSFHCPELQVRLLPHVRHASLWALDPPESEVPAPEHTSGSMYWPSLQAVQEVHTAPLEVVDPVHALKSAYWPAVQVV